jgi:hypothetical protein
VEGAQGCSAWLYRTGVVDSVQIFSLVHHSPIRRRTPCRAVAASALGNASQNPNITTAHAHGF